MKPFRYLNYSTLLTILSSVWLLGGCGVDTNTGSNHSISGDTVSSLWSSAGLTNPVDTGNGTALWPVVAKEPDGGGTALAVWIEQTDLNPFDTFPQVYHLYARWFDGTDWASTDAACPADGQPENSDGDGICVIDTGNPEFGTWSHQVSIDDNGDAIVLWAQTGCLANPTGGSCNDYENGDRWVSNIYARRFSGGSWGATAEEIDAGDQVGTCPGVAPACVEIPAFNPNLAIEPDSGGSAMAVWEQRDGTTWRIYARRLSAGLWTTPCPGAGCPLIDFGLGAGHRPRVRMDSAGNAFAGFIQFVDATCYEAPVARTTPVDPFNCPHNRLYYTIFTASTGLWSAPTDITPPTSLPNLLGCFDYFTTSSNTGNPEAMDCGAWGCNTVETGIVNTNTCRTFSDYRLSMDRIITVPPARSATVVYKSMEWASVTDLTCTGANVCGGTTLCDCFAWGCNCDVVEGQTTPSDTYQQIRIEAWRNTGGSGTRNNLARYYYLDGSTNCSSTNPSDGEDFRRILNCDLDSPTVAVEPDGGGTRIALWERYDGATRTIRSRRFSGSWAADTFVAGSAAFPTAAPQIVMDDAGNGLAMFVQFLGDNKWHVRSNTHDGTGWLGNVTVDSGLPSEDGYFNPVVAMDRPGAALALLIGFTDSFGFTLYGVIGP